MTGTLTSEHGLHLLREMVRVRRMEEKCAELYQQEKIRGFLHLYIGQEAVAVGVMQSVRAEDAVVATYREHGHALLKGTPMGTIMAEMFGKVEGCSRGRGGSMHLFDREHGVFGGNAIVGGHLPMSVGLALANRMSRRDAVTVCFFGEGAAAEGEFHEAMNLAALWSVPVVFVCENNLYAMGTALHRSESQTEIWLKAQSYGVPAEKVDGMDVRAVEAAAGRAVAAVRDGRGPYFLELRTYRFRAHSMFDPERYRDAAEVAEWKKRDPITRLEADLRARGWLDDADRTRLEDEVASEVADAVAFAEGGTWEPIEELGRFVVMAEVGP